MEALKALKVNPMDLEAMKVYHDCHKKVCPVSAGDVCWPLSREVLLHACSYFRCQFQAWAQSKHKPGQYTGSVDFKPLTPNELSGPNPAWVRKVCIPEIVSGQCLWRPEIEC